jgi:alginate O-acetyltransferase complex protein AlgI
MPFLSFKFLLAAATALAVFYALPRRWRPGFLLLCSLSFFTLAGPAYLPLIILLTLADFKLALWMTAAGASRRRGLLWLGMLLNGGVLVFFKFTFLLNGLLAPWLPAWSEALSRVRAGLLVPLGLSYFIFKKLSYLLDCYWGRSQPEKRFSRLLLYVIFFPEITAGPIDRAGRLLPQLAGNRRFDRLDISAGFHQILWGLFKKIVIADRLAELVNPVFKNAGQYQSQVILAAVLLFSIQIYSDFSGYSDMAIGLGRLFGFRLQMNFDRPYFALSVGEFWKRWHVSLSLWLRDYLFLPLSSLTLRRFPQERILGVRTEVHAYALASLATMTACGIWHGAAWTFAAWGLLHGIYLVFGVVTRRGRRRLKKGLGLSRHPALHRSLQRLITFLLVSLAWIFFASPSLPGAISVFRRLLTPGAWFAGAATGWSAWSHAPGEAEFAVAGGAVLSLVLVEALQGRIRFGRWLRSRQWLLRWAAYYLFILGLLFFGIFASATFIYQGF